MINFLTATETFVSNAITLCFSPHKIEFLVITSFSYQLPLFIDRSSASAGQTNRLDPKELLHFRHTFLYPITTHNQKASHVQKYVQNYPFPDILPSKQIGAKLFWRHPSYFLTFKPNW